MYKQSNSFMHDFLTAFIKSKQIMSEVKMALEKAILQPTNYLHFSVLLTYKLFHVKVEDCSALFLIIVKHLTRSTEQCYKNKLLSHSIGKVLSVILNMYKSIRSCVMHEQWCEIGIYRIARRNKTRRKLITTFQ